VGVLYLCKHENEADLSWEMNYLDLVVMLRGHCWSWLGSCYNNDSHSTVTNSSISEIGRAVVAGWWWWFGGVLWLAVVGLASRGWSDMVGNGGSYRGSN